MPNLSMARLLDGAQAVAGPCQPRHLPGVPVEVVAWREETEVDEIRRFHVGIMPLPDEPWARGKCG
ncbi:MAG: hypothetical protein VW495_06415, partial [Rhodobiaceae bacterium]